MVAALDTNSDLYIAGYYAAAKAGLTFLPLNYRAKDAELEYMINTADAKVLLVGDRYLDLVGRIRAAAQGQRSRSRSASGDARDAAARGPDRQAPSPTRPKPKSRTRTSRS